MKALDQAFIKAYRMGTEKTRGQQSETQQEPVLAGPHYAVQPARGSKKRPAPPPENEPELDEQPDDEQASGEAADDAEPARPGVKLFRPDVAGYAAHSGDDDEDSQSEEPANGRGSRRNPKKVPPHEPAAAIANTTKKSPTRTGKPPKQPAEADSPKEPSAADTRAQNAAPAMGTDAKSVRGKRTTEPAEVPVRHVTKLTEAPLAPARQPNKPADKQVPTEPAGRNAPTAGKATVQTQKGQENVAASAYAPPARGKSEPTGLSEVDRLRRQTAAIAGKIGAEEVDDVAPLAPVADPSGLHDLQPLLQVDRFAWPEICQNISEHAPDRLAEMVDHLEDESAHGRKLVAVTSLHTSEGRTSLLLASAKALAARGRKVCLVDAEWQKARLAQSLGVMPEWAWEDVLSGKQTLAEVLIESVEDGVVLLPLATGADMPLHDAETQTAVRHTLAELRDAYDLVLIEAGTLENNSRGGHSILGCPELDAALLVRDVRLTNRDELERAVELLCATGLGHYGLAENFVPPAN